MTVKSTKNYVFGVCQLFTSETNSFPDLLSFGLKVMQEGPNSRLGTAVWKEGTDSNLHQNEMTKERISICTVQIYAHKSQMAELIKLRSN